MSIKNSNYTSEIIMIDTNNIKQKIDYAQNILSTSNNVQFSGITADSFRDSHQHAMNNLEQFENNKLSGFDIYKRKKNLLDDQEVSCLEY